MTSVALVVTHYYTAMLSLAILSSISLTTIIRKGTRTRIFNIIFPCILTATILLYSMLYAHGVIRFVLTVNWPYALLFQIIFYFSAQYVFSKLLNQNSLGTILICVTVLAIAIFFAWLATSTPIVAGAPVLPTRYIIYMIPFILSFLLGVLGRDKMMETNNKNDATILWLATVLALEGFAILGNNTSGLGFTLAYRGINFLVPPLAVLSALGVYRLFRTKRSSMQKFAKATAVATVLIIVTFNIYGVYATVHLQERYLGYFWLYNKPEYETALWITNFSSQTVAGDLKVFYLLNYYFNVKVDVSQCINYLTQTTSSSPQILFIYDQMLNNGYVDYRGYGVDPPENWTNRLSNLNLVYSNGVSYIYHG